MNKHLRNMFKDLHFLAGIKRYYETTIRWHKWYFSETDESKMVLSKWVFRMYPKILWDIQRNALVFSSAEAMEKSFPGVNIQKLQSLTISEIEVVLDIVAFWANIMIQCESRSPKNFSVKLFWLTFERKKRIQRNTNFAYMNKLKDLVIKLDAKRYRTSYKEVAKSLRNGYEKTLSYAEYKAQLERWLEDWGVPLPDTVSEEGQEMKVSINSSMLKSL